MKSFRFSGRAAVVCSLILAVGVPSAAMGFGEGRTLLLGKRNPSNRASLTLSAETEIIADNTTYATRQSNKRDGDGGGAIYGCRSSLGSEPCLRARNLKGGRAFEFSTIGLEGGRIEAGNATGAPFTTNATGVATGLNADRVDGKDATDLDDAETVGGKKATDLVAAADLLFAIVTEKGTTDTVAGRGATTVAGTGDAYTVTFNRDVSKCSYTASAVGTTTTPAPEALTVSAGSTATQVIVTGVSSDPPPAPPAVPADTSIHLQVVC